MERAGNQKEVWVICPECKRYFNAEKLLWEDPQFAHLLLYCPFCTHEFARDESPQVYGLTT